MARTPHKPDSKNAIVQCINSLLLLAKNIHANDDNMHPSMIYITIVSNFFIHFLFLIYNSKKSGCIRHCTHPPSWSFTTTAKYLLFLLLFEKLVLYKTRQQIKIVINILNCNFTCLLNTKSKSML